VYDLSLVERGGNEAGDEVGGAGDKVEEAHELRLGSFLSPPSFNLIIHPFSL
jgi:hypothetical protein